MGIRKKKPAALAAADISCPGCGSVNSVRVAGIYESPRSPHKWYCRCDHCRKGFVPKPKGTCELIAQPGGDDMAHGDKIKAAREKLPKEELERLVWEMSDEKIAEVKGISYWQVRQLKEEYGLVGIIGRGGRNKFKKKEFDTMLGENTVTVQDESNDLAENVTKAGENVNDLTENVTEPGEIITEPDLEPANSKSMTVAAAIEHRANMSREVDCIKSMMQILIEGEVELAPGVLALLKGYQEGCNTSLERVTKAFETVEITF